MIVNRIVTARIQVCLLLSDRDASDSKCVQCETFAFYVSYSMKEVLDINRKSQYKVKAVTVQRSWNRLEEQFKHKAVTWNSRIKEKIERYSTCVVSAGRPCAFERVQNHNSAMQAPSCRHHTCVTLVAFYALRLTISNVELQEEIGVV